VSGLALVALAAGCTERNTQAADDSGVSGADTGVNPALTYPIVDTAQGSCSSGTAKTACPASGKDYFGQDAQWAGNAPRYTVSKDGLTVKDGVTGLTWQRSPDRYGDGKLTAADKLTWAQAPSYPATLNKAKYGGFTDWRLPTIKELYSLILFTGTDPDPSASGSGGLVPFIDNKAFKFAYGDASAGERVIDSQYASSTVYVSKAAGQMLFGVNFADGRIKGYDTTQPSGKQKTFFVQCVRGATSYGKNKLKNNVDGTVTDEATGLTWELNDSGKGMTWKEALAWAQTKNAAKHLGHSDWRLPNAKELQSIVDYSRSPDTTQSAAIDVLFAASKITNEGGAVDYPYYWSSTTHKKSNGMMAAAVYVAFGRSPGYMKSSWRDVHGAGSQRSDPKSGDPKKYPQGHGPQGDAIRIYNYVRLVRGGATLTPGGGTSPDGGVVPPKKDGGVAPPRKDGGGTGPASCTTQADCNKPGNCPPGHTLGCKCMATPGPGGGGKVCLPSCKKASDCPKHPSGTPMRCNAQGVCTP